MTVDVTAFRVVARGSHEKGYRGVIEIGFHAALIPFDCGHRHPATAEARDCIRKRVWRLIDADDVAPSCICPDEVVRFAGHYNRCPQSPHYEKHRAARLSDTGDTP